MDYPLISTVITAYNYGRTLGEAIDGALAQDYPNHEVLVLDNASTDETPEIMARYAAQPRLRYIRNPINIGATKNHNRGVIESRGEYIQFLSADDRCKPDFISSSYAYLMAHPNVDIVFSELDLIDNGGAPCGRRRAIIAAEHDNHPYQLAAFLVYGCYAAFETMVVPREIYGLYGLMDERLTGADFELIVRWAAAGVRFGYLPKAFLEYRVHENQDSGSSFLRSGKFLNEFFDILDKHLTPDNIPKLRDNECGIGRHINAKIDVSAASGFEPDVATTGRIDEMKLRLRAIREAHLADPLPAELSIIILADSDLVKLQRTLRSLANQTLTRWEALIVHPRDVEVRFQDPSGRLKDVRLAEPLNESEALNIGLRLARGNRFLFLRSGNTYPPEHLERIQWTYDHIACDILVTPATLRIEAAGGLTEAPVFAQPGDRDLGQIAPSLALDGLAVRKSAFDLLAKFSEQMTVLSEWERLAFFTAKNVPIGIITNSTVYLHETPGIAGHYVRSNSVVESLRLVYSCSPPPDERTAARREEYVADIEAALAEMRTCSWTAADHLTWYQRLDGRRFALGEAPVFAASGPA